LYVDIDRYIHEAEIRGKRMWTGFEGKAKYQQCGRRKTNENKLEIETVKFEKGSVLQISKLIC
jgi:hypothetical protein